MLQRAVNAHAKQCARRYTCARNAFIVVIYAGKDDICCRALRLCRYVNSESAMNCLYGARRLLGTVASASSEMSGARNTR